VLVFGLRGNPHALVMGDVNGDGRLDLVAANPDSNSVSVLINATPGLTSVGPPLVPAKFQLLAVRPNPSRAGLQVKFQLPRAEAVDAEIYDVAGRRTRNLLTRQVLKSGEHALTWDGRDDDGARSPSGLYLVRVGAGDEGRVGRIVLLGP